GAGHRRALDLVSAPRVEVAHRPQAVSDELAFASALDLATRVRAREISPAELTALYLERIERLDPQVNAYVTVVDEPDAPRDGPFHGVPIPIKDLNETAGIRTTFS